MNLRKKEIYFMAEFNQLYWLEYQSASQEIEKN